MKSFILFLSLSLLTCTVFAQENHTHLNMLDKYGQLECQRVKELGVFVEDDFLVISDAQSSILVNFTQSGTRTQKTYLGGQIFVEGANTQITLTKNRSGSNQFRERFLQTTQNNQGQNFLINSTFNLVMLDYQNILNNNAAIEDLLIDSLNPFLNIQIPLTTKVIVEARGRLGGSGTEGTFSGANPNKSYFLCE